MVGTSAGSVHKQRQGTGLATVLGPSISAKDFAYLDNQEQAGLAAAKKAKAETLAAAKQKILEFNPERWLKHELEVRDMQTKWVDQGAKLLNSGTNPYNGTDEASIRWRNERDRIEAYANASTQMKDMFKALRSKIDGSDPDKYDPETIKAINDYFDMPVKDVVEKGILPPELMQKKPTANLQKSWVGLVTDLQTRTGQGEFSDKERFDFITQSTANSEDLNEAAQSYFANLPKAVQDDYKARSQSTGRAITDLVHYDFMKRYEKNQPFDLNKFIQQGADSVDVPYSEVRTPSGFGKYVDTKELTKIANTKAMVMLTDPTALQEYESLLPREENENDGAYRTRAIGDLTKRIKDLKSTSTLVGKTEKGEGDAQLNASGELWLQHIKSEDPEKYKEAAGYLFQTPGVLGLNVSESIVLDNPLTTEPRVLLLKLKGKPSLEKVKEAISESMGAGTNFTYSSVNPWGEVRVPITNQTENALLKMHDKAFKEAKIPYKGSRQEWNVDGIINQSKTAKF